MTKYECNMCRSQPGLKCSRGHQLLLFSFIRTCTHQRSNTVTPHAYTLSPLGLWALAFLRCAQAAAGYHELLDSGTINPGQVTVILLTSTGVKATPGMAMLLGIDL